jgi:hypothetical protein
MSCQQLMRCNDPPEIFFFNIFFFVLVLFIVEFSLIGRDAAHVVLEEVATFLQLLCSLSAAREESRVFLSLARRHSWSIG